eukprot:CAMPEP_0195084772 /NCGR_PEP_ID=MMETSP0448-20130528/25386_1 /TAXON_ID=66468 /ORGANISM="Heterocapsa triquestra, Strain CCMP 448" /LENGTH=75 /DNA_ID=CAMNT_0040118127 /DNA_START=8 /DNA_END=231 /DNA_ORIENTATION=-
MERLQKQKQVAEQILVAKEEIVEQQLLQLKLQREEEATAALLQRAMALSVEEEVLRRAADLKLAAGAEEAAVPEV